MPEPPANQAMPRQESGQRPARPAPYALQVTGDEDRVGGAVRLTFTNSGAAAAVFQVRSAVVGVAPRTYTVGARQQISDLWKVTGGVYDLSVHGLNGFLHSFAGDFASPTVAAAYDAKQGSIRLDFLSSVDIPHRLHITSAYTGKTISHVLDPDEFYTLTEDLEESFGWYDFTIESETLPKFRRRLAGHVETGRDSMTDPAIG